jgi:hypothetical protein
MKYGCRNQEDEISLECTDLRRGVLKYMTVDGDVKHIKVSHMDVFEFFKTKKCKAIRDNIVCEDTLNSLRNSLNFSTLEH